MQAVMCTLVIIGIRKDLRYKCLLYFNANVTSGKELNTIYKTRKKLKLHSSNDGKAVWPLCCLCSGRAVILVRSEMYFCV